MAISNNSTGLRPGVCTSTTRPVSPYEGQSIYQTDTDTVLFWDGSAWVAPYATTAALNLKANIASPTFTGGSTTVTGTATNVSNTINAPAGYYAMQYFAIGGTNEWHYEVTPSGGSWALVESGVAARMTVNSGSGVTAFSNIVTKASNPMFSAYPAVNYGLSGTNILYHTSTLNNIGGHYNTSNYRFTAPVAGVYHFSLNLNVYNLETGNYFMPALYKNGAGLHYGDRRFGSGGTDTNSNVSASVYLAAGDYIQPYCVSDDGSYNISGGNIWNSFTGVLLG